MMDTYVCQICGTVRDSQQHPSVWRPDITGSTSAGNVCPSCLATHNQLLEEAYNDAGALDNEDKPLEQPLLRSEISTAVTALRFMLSGNAYFTIRSKRTGARYTFRVATPKKARQAGEEFWYVSLLNGPDNTTNYNYLGNLKGRTELKFWQTDKCQVGPQAPSAVAFRWLLQHLRAGLFHPELEFWHEGRCGRCGRMLTVPESVARGIGPECAGRL